MISLLRAILQALLDIIANQKASTAQVADLGTDLGARLTAQSAAIEHLRVLIEDDSIPIVVGTPTFTPTGGPQ